MREIKFRAWDKEYKRMFDNETWKAACAGMVKVAKYIVPDADTAQGGLYLPLEDKNMVFMQYTGLKDKNGKEGYQDDILDTSVGKAVIRFGEYGGAGHMSKVMESLNYKVFSSDLYDRGYGMAGIDFLETKKAEFYRSEWIITNPPFSLSEQFIRRSIDHKKPFALLLKSQYWHSSRRRKLFEEYKPAAVLPLTWRPDFLFGAKSGSPTMECVWTVWEDKPARNTIYQPLRKPKLKREG